MKQYTENIRTRQVTRINLCGWMSILEFTNCIAVIFQTMTQFFDWEVRIEVFDLLLKYPLYKSTLGMAEPGFQVVEKAFHGSRSHHVGLTPVMKVWFEASQPGDGSTGYNHLLEWLGEVFARVLFPADKFRSNIGIRHRSRDQLDMDVLSGYSVSSSVPWG